MANMDYLTSRGHYLLTRALAARVEKDGVLAQHLRRNYAGSSKDEEDEGAHTHLISPLDLNDDELRHMAKLAIAGRHPRLAKLLNAIADFEDTPVPNFEAAYPMLVRWLRKNVPGGWLYQDGARHAKPYLITDVSLRIPESYLRRSGDEKPSVTITLAATNTSGDGYGRRPSVDRSIHLHPSDVTRRKVDRIIDADGLALETPELRADYEAQHAHLRKHILGGYARQYRQGRTEQSPGSKVLMVTDDRTMLKVRDMQMTCPVAVSQTDGGYGEALPLPVHPIVNIFDLGTQDHGTCNVMALTPYQYDATMADKLILPESHMDMLDVLTTDTDAFLADIVEGKSAGNIILCKGIPGIGKTLTAEVYSEVVRKPIYTVHSGSLGTTPHEVEKQLKLIFERVQNWDCLLLLDEADVFVRQRGADLVQNAIVAVFLRTLEYFDGLMFMTTNRSDDIDDAIISRCAAIIDYGLPSRNDMAAIWKVMAAQQGTELADELVEDLVETFPKAAPRDVKHLLRLALRVSAKQGVPMNEELFRRVGMFRAVHIAPHVPKAQRKELPRVRRRVRSNG